MKIKALIFCLFCFCATVTHAVPKESYIPTKQAHITDDFIDSINTVIRLNWKKDNIDIAIEKLLLLLSEYQKIDNTIGIIKTCNKLGFLYLKVQDFDRAFSYFKNAHDLNQARKLHKNLLFNQLILAYINLQEDDFVNTQFYLKEASNSVMLLGDSSLIRRMYGITALYYEKIKDNDKALDYFKRYELITIALIETHRNSANRNAFKDIILDTETNLLDDNIKFGLHNLQLKEKEDRIEQVQKVKNILLSGIIVNVIVLLVLVYLLIDRIRDNRVLNQKNLKIEQQKSELSLQKEKLTIQNKNITSSINYAQTIQNASLADLNLMSEMIDFALFYRPKDIVSGDFYWYHKVSDTTCLVAVVDSTGHGVPGAFMSLIGIQLLNEIVVGKRIEEPAAIITELNKSLFKALKQETSENEDGMDICLCKIEKKENLYNITYSGAKRPLYFYSKTLEAYQIIAGNPNSTGGRYAKKANIEYTQIQIEAQPGDFMILSSDGMIDQPTKENKKYGSQRFLEQLKKGVALNSKEQMSIFVNDFETMKKEDQRDDLTVLLIKF